MGVIVNFRTYGNYYAIDYTTISCKSFLDTHRVQAVRGKKGLKAERFEQERPKPVERENSAFLLAELGTLRQRSQGLSCLPHRSYPSEHLMTDDRAGN
jgi:hypothetical protein